MVLDELRHAVRNLGRAPRFVCASVVTLALALSGTATLLNLLEAFVFRKLAVPAPEQLVGICPVRAKSSVGFPPATLAALRARQRTLTHQLSAISYQLSALGCRLSALNFGHSLPVLLTADR